MNNSNNIVISNKPLRVGFLWSTRVFLGFASSDKIWFPCTCVCVCASVASALATLSHLASSRMMWEYLWIWPGSFTLVTALVCMFDAIRYEGRLKRWCSPADSLSLFLSDHHRNPSQFTHIRLSGQRETLNRIGFQHGFSSWGHNQHLQKVSCSNLEHSVMLGALCQKKRVCL